MTKTENKLYLSSPPFGVLRYVERDELDINPQTKLHKSMENMEISDNSRIVIFKLK
jgi:hypothetical protein